MSTGRQGADRLSLEEASRRLVVMEAHLAKILARLKHAGLLGAEAKLLDVGATFATGPPSRYHSTTGRSISVTPTACWSTSATRRSP